MKSIFRLSIFVLYLFVACCCSDDGIKTDPRFQTDIRSESVTGKHYANAPSELIIKLTRKDGKTGGKYKFFFSNLEGSGEVFINGQRISEDETAEINSEKFQASYFPLCLGEHKLKLTFTNSDFLTETIYSLSVNEYSVKLTQPSTEVENIPLNKAFYIDFDLYARNDSIGKFKATVDFVKGNGHVAFTDAKLRPQNSAPAIIALTGNTDSLFFKPRTSPELHTGPNRILCKPGETGENTIRINLTNHFGYSQSFDFSFPVALPAYNVNIAADTITLQGRNGNFTLKLESEEEESEFFVSYNSKSNKCHVTIDGNETIEGKNITLPAGIHKGTFSADSCGNAAIEFHIKDKYNVKKNIPLSFRHTESLTQIDVSAFSNMAKLNQESSFSLSAITPGYEGKYKCRIIPQPLGSAVIWIDGKEHNSSFTHIAIPSLIKFKPLTTGNNSLEIRIIDDTNTETIKTISFNVPVEKKEIVIKDFDPIISPGNRAQIEFDIDETDYDGNYTCEIVQAPENAGSIILNGISYTGGKSNISKSGNIISFTPSISGEIKLTIKTYNHKGNCIQSSCNLSVSNSPITLSVSDFTKDVLLGNTTSFSFIPKGAQPTLTYNITSIPHNAATLTINGGKYTLGQDIRIANSASEQISIKPIRAGNIQIILNVSDGFSSISYPLNYSVNDNPISIQLQETGSKIIKNKEHTFSLSASKEGYNGKFMLDISTEPSQTGKIKVNGTIYTADPIELEKESIISYTPSISGIITHKLKVTDDFGSTETRDIRFEIETPQLTVSSLSAIDEIISPQKGGGLNLSANKPGYTGKFYIEIEHSGCSSIKVANVPYRGKTEVDPGNIPVRFYPSRNNPVNLKIHLSDEEGSVWSKEYVFKVSDSDLLLTIKNPVSETSTGKSLLFNFSAEKPGYTGKITYKVSAATARLNINGKPYASGTENLLNPGEDIPVQITFIKEGVHEVKVNVKNTFGEEKSKILHFNVTANNIIITPTGFSSSAIINTENTCCFSITGNEYNGGYKCFTKVTPTTAGSVKIDGIFSEDGGIQLQNPINTKLTFFPKIKGEATVTITIQDDYGNTAIQEFSYFVLNPETEIFTGPLPHNIVAGKEASLSFLAVKQGYNDNYYCEIIPSGISGILLNGINYTGGKETISHDNNILKFIPAKSGENAVTLRIIISDKWGGRCEKEYSFNVLNTEISFNVSQSGDRLLPGEEKNFILTAKSTCDTLEYSLDLLPSGIGELYTEEGKFYGKQQIISGKPENIVFKALKEGEAIIRITMNDKFGTKAEKSISYKIANAPINIAGIDPLTNGKEIIIGEKNAVDLLLTREGFSGEFTCKVITDADNSSNLKLFLNGNPLQCNEPFMVHAGVTSRLEIEPLKFTLTTGSLEISDGFQSILQPISLPAVYKYKIKQIPVTMSFTKTNEDNEEHRFYMSSPFLSSFMRIYAGGYGYKLKGTDTEIPVSSFTLPIGGGNCIKEIGKLNVPDLVAGEELCSYIIRQNLYTDIKTDAINRTTFFFKDGSRKTIEGPGMQIDLKGDLSLTDIQNLSSVDIKTILLTEKKETVEIPVSFVIEKDKADPGIYSFNGNIVGNSLSLGTISQELSGDRLKSTQNLGNLKVLSDNKGTYINLSLQSGRIAWNNAPLQKAELGYKITRENGIIITEGVINNLEVTGTFSGNKEWNISAPFERGEIEDPEKLKGARLEIYYNLTAAEPQYFDIPAKFKLSRDMNKGSYSFRSQFWYKNYTVNEGEALQMKIGEVNTELRENGENLYTKELGKARVRILDKNNAFIDIMTMATDIIWKGCPATETTFGYRVIAGNGLVLTQGVIQNTSVTGKFEGDKGWGFASDFQRGEITDTELLKTSHLEIYYMLGNRMAGNSDMIINTSGVNRNLIIGRTTKFNFHATEQGVYNGNYTFKIEGTSVESLKVNGKTYYGWNEASYAFLQEMQISFTAAATVMQPDPKVTLYIRDASGKEVSAFAAFNTPVYEYIEIPAEYIFERESTNNGTYSIKASAIEFKNLTEDNLPSGQLSTGNIDMTLPAGNNTNKISKDLGNIRIFRNVKGEGIVNLYHQGTVISWENSPLQRSYLAFDIISPDGDILDHEILLNQNPYGQYSGNQGWEFASQFRQMNIPDWEALKGARMIIYYKLRNPQADGSALSIIISNKAINIKKGETARFKVSIIEQGNYTGKYFLFMEGNNITNLKCGSFTSGTWQEASINDLLEMKFSFTPSNASAPSVLVRVKDANNKITEQEVFFNIPTSN